MIVYREVARPPGLALDLARHLDETQLQLARLRVPGFSTTTAAANQTLRFDGTNWVNSAILLNDGTNITIAGGLRVGLGTLALTSDEFRYTASGRTDGVRLFHAGVGNYTLAMTSTGALALLGGASIAIGPSTGGTWVVNSSGHLIGNSDNTYDLGASGASRPRTAYFGTSVVIGTDPTGSSILRVGGAARLNTTVGIGGDTAANVTVNLTPAAGSRALVVVGATHTTSQPILDLAQTWNASGVTFTALKLNVTNTASAAGSKLIDLQLGAATKFSVDKDGILIAVGASIGTGSVNSTGGVVISSSAVGTIALDIQSTGSGQPWINAGNWTLGVGGEVSQALGTITTDIRFLDGSVTWNAAGVAFKGLTIDVVNTASAAGARIVDLSVSGSSKFAVDISGYVYIASTKVVGTRVTGYTAMTGTPNRATAYATSTITLVQLAERVKALQDDLTTHGLIGA